MKLSALLSCGLLCTILLGCANQNDPNGIKSLSKSDSDRLNAEHSNSNAPEPTLTADTHFAAAQLAEASNAPDAAIKQYDAALKEDPKHLPSLYRLGVLLTTLKNYPDALDTWQKYVEATGNSASSYGNLGFCQEMAGQPEKAEETYQKGITKDPKNVQCRTNYGLMLARHNRTAEAIRAWQPVLSEAEIHYNLASVYELNSRRAEARAEFQKAIDADPKFSEAKERLSSLDAD